MQKQTKAKTKTPNIAQNIQKKHKHLTQQHNLKNR